MQKTPLTKFSTHLWFSSVHFHGSVVSNSLWPHESQHSRPPCPSPTPGGCSDSCRLSQWCHLNISSSVAPFSSSLLFFPAIRVFSNGLAVCIRWPKYWSWSFIISPSSEYSGLISLGLIGLISSQSKGLSRVFSNITVVKHKFFTAQLSLWSSFHMTTGKP